MVTVSVDLKTKHQLVAHAGKADLFKVTSGAACGGETNQ